jgi:rhomboid protease GluP
MLRRRPGALAEGEWWRLVTPLFVHPGGWPQIAFNFTGIAVCGVLVERLFGPWRWLLLYFLPGLVGEIAGYAWHPTGAGASVGGAGLLGALLAWLAARPELPPRARLGGGAGLLGAVALTVFRDIHGPPVLAGAALAALMLAGQPEVRRS